MIHVLVSRRKRDIFDEYLGHWGLGVASFVQLHCYEELPEASVLPGGTWVFTDIDELRPAPLELACVLCETVTAAGMRVLNDPRAALRRYPLLRLLHERGLNRFRVFEARGDLSAVRFPVFIRRASNHKGSLTPLLQDRIELARWLVWVRLTGEPLDDLLVIEFLNTADSEGLFRKYAAFIVGERVIPRSLNRGTHWMLKHNTTEFNLDFQQEELDFVEANPHAAAIAQIARLAGIDYGRIDYAMLDGAVQTWEINMCPTIGRGIRPSTGRMPPEISALRNRAKEQFYSGFAEAWQALDVPTAQEVSVAFSRAQRRTAARAFARAGSLDWLRLLRTLLRPFKPVLHKGVDYAVGAIASRGRRG